MRRRDPWIKGNFDFSLEYYCSGEEQLFNAVDRDIEWRVLDSASPSRDIAANFRQHLRAEYLELSPSMRFFQIGTHPFWRRAAPLLSVGCDFTSTPRKIIRQDQIIIWQLFSFFNKRGRTAGCRESDHAFAQAGRLRNPNVGKRHQRTWQPKTGKRHDRFVCVYTCILSVFVFLNLTLIFLSSPLNCHGP